MGHPSTLQFRTFHALRIKGFAAVDTLVEMTTIDTGDVQQHLESYAADGLTQFREARSLWQLTPDGRAAHSGRLAADLAGIDVSAMLTSSYSNYLQLNGEFKQLCSDWQLRDGEINDHSDAAHDDSVVARLAGLDARAQPVIGEIGSTIDRFQPYAPRLESALRRVLAGESNMFTGVMCGSYHDAWMELHEDLILSQGIDRTAEGSF